MSQETTATNVNPVSISSNTQVLNPEDIIDPSKFHCWFKLLSATANVLKYKYSLRFKAGHIDQIPSKAILMKEAKMIWIKSMMKETKKMLKERKISGFIIHEKDGIMYAKTRSKQENLNPEDLIILSPSHPITKKILYSIHNICHKGVQHTVARSRIFYWIPQCSKLVKSIKNHCFECRRLDAKAMEQLMSPLPSFRLKPSPIWFYSMLDLFGPIEITDYVNQRTTRKTWGVIITCLTTRACWVYLAESYSTDHLLTVLRKHETRNGSPSVYMADLGRQIVGADRVMSEAISNIDVNVLETFAANRNVKFVFGTPHFPEGQGACERLIKEVKQSLRVITKNKHLTFGELDCLLSEASYLVNSRPLQYNPTAGDDGYICPNDILFGRSDMEPPAMEISDTSMTRRAAHKQRIIDEFWSKWIQSYHQTLVKYHRWTQKFRNSTPGDIVMILDKEGWRRGKFCLGIVDSVKVDPDQQVRKVVVKYKTKPRPDQQRNVFKYAERNVRGLALLIKAEEREDFENTEVDNARFDPQVELDNSNDEEIVDNVEENDENKESHTRSVDNVEEVEEMNSYEPNDDNLEETEGDQVNVNREPSDPLEDRIIAPSSTGRKRWAPSKLFL